MFSLLLGIFIALMLRFDLSRSVSSSSPKSNAKIAAKKASETSSQAGSDATTADNVQPPFTKTYFNATMISYVIGLAVTVIVMYAFKAAQPALLYLVPAILIGSMGTALVRGELKELLSYSEEKPKDPQEIAKKED